jgi:hypothetical protein
MTRSKQKARKQPALAAVTPYLSPREIRLSRAETTKEGALPAVCMRCGAPATRTVTRFRTNQVQGGTSSSLLADLLGFLFAAAVNAMNEPCEHTVHVPLCDRHVKHWSLWTTVTITVIFLCFAPGIAWWMWSFVNNPSGSMWADPVLVPLLLSAGVLGLVAFWVYSHRNGPIRLKDLTRESVTVTGVSPRFIEAVMAARDAGK